MKQNIKCHLWTLTKFPAKKFANVIYFLYLCIWKQAPTTHQQKIDITKARPTQNLNLILSEKHTQLLQLHLEIHAQKPPLPTYGNDTKRNEERQRKTSKNKKFHRKKKKNRKK